MGQLKTWRDTILAKLKSDVTNAARISQTASVKLSMGLDDWPSPTIWLEIESIVAARPELIGAVTQQLTHSPVNVYIAVRLGTRDANTQELEYNEEAVSVGTFDLLDAVLDSLHGFTVQHAPIAKLILVSAMEFMTADGCTVWKVAFEMTGGYIAH